MRPPSLSVVVPTYHQAPTIARELHDLHTLLSDMVPSHEIIVVIDGNADNTAAAVEQLAIPALRVECFDRNQGKGMALRHGLALARGKLVAFIDAGGDLAPEFLEIMLVEMKLHHADIVIGSKRHSLSEVSYPLRRRLYSRTYQVLNRLLFQLKIRDTQVGLKLFRREVLDAVLPRILVKQFAFDLELLVVANHLGFRRIVEAPVKLHHGFVSSVTWRAVYQTLWDTLAIFYRLHVLHWYDHAPAPAAATVTNPVAITIQSTPHPARSEPLAVTAKTPARR